jgi:hypothetical protein
MSGGLFANMLPRETSQYEISALIGCGARMRRRICCRLCERSRVRVNCCRV